MPGEGGVLEDMSIFWIVHMVLPRPYRQQAAIEREPVADDELLRLDAEVAVVVGEVVGVLLGAQEDAVALPDDVPVEREYGVRELACEVEGAGDADTAQFVMAGIEAQVARLDRARRRVDRGVPEDRAVL